MHVVIGVPTYCRPMSLQRLLASLNELEIPSGVEVEVLVADNDGIDGEGMQVVSAASSCTEALPTRAIGVSERGLSAVRNTLLREAFESSDANCLIMVDDDLRVEPQWLSALLEMQQQTHADVVSGRVLPEFEATPPAWVLDQGIYYVGGTDSGPIGIVYGTTSVLLMRRVVTHFDGWFHPDFGLSGGEDRELFLRLQQGGAKFAHAADARAYEWYGASRTSLNWALERAFRIGSSDMVVARLHVSGAGWWFKEGVKILLAFAVAVIKGGVFFWHASRRVQALLLAARQVGKVAGLLGHTPNVYTRIHGT